MMESSILGCQKRSNYNATQETDRQNRDLQLSIDTTIMPGKSQSIARNYHKETKRSLLTQSVQNREKMLILAELKS